MTPILPWISAAGSSMCAPHATVLDYSQVSQRASRSQTEAVSGTVWLDHPSWESPLERSHLMVEALGRQIDADEIDRRAFTAAFTSRTRATGAERSHRGTLPLEL